MQALNIAPSSSKRLSRSLPLLLTRKTLQEHDIQTSTEVRQFYGGRVCTEAAVVSTCYRCNQQGQLVPVGEEIQLRQFKCDCDDHAWYERAEISVCRSCNENGVLIPIGEELEYRQFKCDNCNGRRWNAMAERSQCQLCNNFGELIPVKEEIGVFVCKFVCDCEQCGCARNREKYHVICEMSDTAICYRDSGHLYHHVTTDNTHSCSKCNGSGDCPNLRPQEHVWKCENCQRTWFEVADRSQCRECCGDGIRTAINIMS